MVCVFFIRDRHREAKANCKRKLEKIFPVKPSSICPCSGEISQLHCTSQSPGEVLKPLTLTGGGVNHHMCSPSALRDSNVQPRSEARWPYNLCLRKSCTTKGQKLQSDFQAWQAIWIPWGAVIEMHAPGSYPRPLKPESRKWGSAKLRYFRKKKERKKDTKKLSKYTLIVNRA